MTSSRIGAAAPAATPTVSVSLSRAGCSFTATYTWSGFAAGRHTVSVVVIENTSFLVGVFTQPAVGTSGKIVHTFGPTSKAPPGVINLFHAFGQLSDTRSGTSIDASTDFPGQMPGNCRVVQ